VSVTIQPNYLGDVLKYEADNRYCREIVTVLGGVGTDRELKLGTVLGKITASGKVKAVDFAANDGSETAMGVLVTDVTAPAGTDVSAVAVVDGPALVSDKGLVWPAGATGEQKAAAIAQLKTAGIKVRQGA
jgi:hypothetical protein